MSEKWRPVVGYEGFYEVSDHGRVRGVDRIVKCGAYGGTRPQYGQVLLPSSNGLGRYQVGLNKEGRQRLYQVHRLILAAFIGPCPLGREGLHWDDDTSNNHLSNLRYGTRSENRHDRVRNGRDQNARRTHCIHGHEFTPENTYLSIKRPGSRQCKACTTHRDRERKAARRAARMERAA
jgi:hypothetical protein